MPPDEFFNDSGKNNKVTTTYDIDFSGELTEFQKHDTEQTRLRL